MADALLPFLIKIILQDIFDILTRIQYYINNFNKGAANAAIRYFDNKLYHFRKNTKNPKPFSQ